MLATKSTVDAPRTPRSAIDPEELGRIPLFKDVDVEVVAPLVRECEVLALETGDVLIAAGRPNSNLYIVLDGKLSVRLMSPNAEPLTHVGQGESVGELSLIDHQPASAAVVAETPSRVLKIEEELVWILSNTSHAISSNLLFTLVRRLRHGNDLLCESQARLEQYRFHATVDALTGLFNRHWLNQMLPRQMHRARTSDEPLSLLMADIDHFKDYNDRLGHPAGDQVLAAVARAIRDHLRPADMPARYGGEEFLVVLPTCDEAGALVVGERLRAAVSACAVNFANGTELPRVSASFGVATLAEHASMSELIAACDEALYRAKRDGRDCVRT